MHQRQPGYAQGEEKPRNVSQLVAVWVSKRELQIHLHSKRAGFLTRDRQSQEVEYRRARAKVTQVDRR